MEGRVLKPSMEGRVLKPCMEGRVLKTSTEVELHHVIIENLVSDCWRTVCGFLVLYFLIVVASKAMAMGNIIQTVFSVCVYVNMSLLGFFGARTVVAMYLDDLVKRGRADRACRLLCTKLGLKFLMFYTFNRSRARELLRRMELEEGTIV